MTAREARIARLTVEQVHAMLAAGILREGEPIELLDGLLVYKDRSANGGDPMTVGRKHNLGVQLLAELDAELRARGAHTQTQGPLTIPPHDEPEPDGAVLRGGPRDYLERLPGAGDTESVIEVADASLEQDRSRKRSTYAGAGIRQYVIVNLRDGVLEVHEDPDEGHYTKVTLLRRGEVLHLRVPGGALAVEVGRLLP